MNKGWSKPKTGTWGEQSSQTTSSSSVMSHGCTAVALWFRTQLDFLSSKNMTWTAQNTGNLWTIGIVYPSRELMRMINKVLLWSWLCKYKNHCTGSYWSAADDLFSVTADKSRLCECVVMVTAHSQGPVLWMLEICITVNVVTFSIYGVSSVRAFSEVTFSFLTWISL